MPINDFAVFLDGINRIRRRPNPFVGDSGVERRQIDWAHRLRPEHEWIESLAIRIDLQFEREPTDTVEAQLGFRLDAVKETGSCLVAGVLKRLSQRNATE